MKDLWFREFPERYQFELDALRDAGIQFREDAVARAQGVICLELEVPDQAAVRAPDGTQLELCAVFPDHYPFFRPEVFGKFRLPRHQHPFSSTLCLLPRPTQFWSTEWTLARLLIEQLPKVLNEGIITDPSVLADNPHEQAEPFSDYLFYDRPANVLVDTCTFPTPTGRRGRLTVGLSDEPSIRPRAALLQVYDDDAGTSYQIGSNLANLFRHKIEGTWQALDEAPPAADAENLRGRLASRGIRIAKARKAVTVRGGKIEGVIGLLFPEEIAPGVLGKSWLFMFSSQEAIQQKNRQGKIFRAAGQKAVLARTGLVSPTVFSERVPKVAVLNSRTISIAGLGCLGAPSALEFARAGVGRLSLLDHDTVDPATTVRWPLGITAAGQFKTAALSAFIRANYPYTIVHTEIVHKIGGLRNRGDVPEPQILDQFCADASLIYDASAEEGVSHLLSRLASRIGIPFVSVYATRGAWGGVIMRQVPGKTEGCWMCFRHAITDGTFPKPPEDHSGGVQPRGCADPTFTGANFDLMNLVLAGVRISATTLCEDEAGAYSDLGWDVGILSLVNADGSPCAPDWQTFKLSRHPNCGYCSG